MYHWTSDLNKHAKIVGSFQEKIADFKLEETRAFDAAKRELDHAEHSHNMAKRREIAKSKAAAIEANAAAFGSASSADYKAEMEAVGRAEALMDTLNNDWSPRGNRTPRDATMTTLTRIAASTSQTLS